MQRMPTTHQFLPAPSERRVVAGKANYPVNWNAAVVYVRGAGDAYDILPTYMYFSCIGCTGDFLIHEALYLVEQWTHFRGRCEREFAPDSHEFRRARQLAVQVIETFRRQYMEEHGTPPNALRLESFINPPSGQCKKKNPRVPKFRATPYKQLDLF